MKLGCPPGLALALLLALLLLPSLIQSKKHHPKVDDSPKAREIPVFRPLRRVIKNFSPTRTASITIVFQSSVTPRIRWFRHLDSNKKLLPNAEIPNMIGIRSDGPNQMYRFRSLSSHDITAVTLSIAPLGDSFPFKFVTCFSLDRSQFQYQLDTYVDTVIQYKSEPLDGIIWMTIPERIIIFDAHGQLTVSCAARLESESSRFTEELNIYRSYLERHQLNGTVQVSSVGTGKIHKERDNFVEESGKYLYKGRREVMSPGRSNSPVLYEVSFTVLNGSQDDVGVYTCAAERARDRTYISSMVKVQQHLRPVLILVPCGDEAISTATPRSPESRRVAIHLVEGQTTCVRCRIFDYEAAWDLKNFDPRKSITLRKDGLLVSQSTNWIHLDWHLNVADGGLIELTVTFLQPSAQTDSGLYHCVAANSLGNETVGFEVFIVPKSINKPGTGSGEPTGYGRLEGRRSFKN